MPCVCAWGFKTVAAFSVEEWSVCGSGWDEVGETEQEEVTRDKEGATGD